jgi:methylmalonyl-CoA mutase
LGITGTGGSGKSSLVDELVRRLVISKNHRINICRSIKRKTGGALLGDRIRMMPSIILAFTCVRWHSSIQSALSKYVADAIQVIKAANYIIILELLELGNLIRNYGSL